jgi:hypothetical protein
MATDPMTDHVIALILQILASTPAEPARPPQPSGSDAIAEVAENVIKCYYSHAAFRAVFVAEQPWSGASKYQADRSALLAITWDGPRWQGYQTQVALLQRGRELRGLVVSDGANFFGANLRCSLERWQKVTK